MAYIVAILSNHGVLMPPGAKKDITLGEPLIGIVLVFMSSRAILNPTSLWQYFLSIASFIGGYQLLTRGRLNF